MRHILFPHHQDHLKKIGIANPPNYLDIPANQYDVDYQAWKRTLPHASHEDLHKRVLAHAAWKEHAKTQNTLPRPIISVPIVHHMPRYERYIIIALLLLIALLLFKGKAHAQFSHIDYVQFTNSGGTTISFFTAPFTIQCLSTMTCTPITGGLSISSNAGGTGCTLQGGTNLLLYDTSTACNDITKWSTNGTTTITGAATAILDLSAAATFKSPASAAFAPTTANNWGYDTTNNRPVLGNGTNTSFLNWITAAPTTNDCTKFTGALGQLADNGGPCPITLASSSHQFVVSYTASTGLFATAQPAAADIGSIPGSSGQLLFNNLGAIGAEDPIVSYAYVNLFNAVAATGTATSSTVRVSTFGQYGELIVTWASITGSPSGCTIQLKSSDSLGNLTNNGSAVAVAPANGTSAILFTPSIYTAAQMQAVFACATTYPSAGTLSLDFVPSITVYSQQGVQGAQASPWWVQPTDGTHNMPMGDASARTIHETIDNADVPTNLAQVGGAAVAEGQTTMSASIPVVIASNQSNVPTNVAQFGGTNVVTGTGAGGSGIPRVTASADSGLYFGQTSYHTTANFAASSTTDNFVFPGNATNTVFITSVKVSCTQTTAGIVLMKVIKRSAADTSGTSSAVTPVPDDSNYAAAVSAPLSYTGTGPSVGAAVGTVDEYYLGCLAAGTASPNDIYILNLRQKPIVLRGTAQQLAINFGGALTGGNLNVTIDHVETTTITP